MESVMKKIVKEFLFEQAIKEEAKLWIDANVWDGEDRSGCLGDSATFNPDELQELANDLLDDLFFRNQKR
jgi:hypothetical protein